MRSGDEGRGAGEGGRRGVRRGVRRWFRLPVRDRVLTEADVEAELASHVEARVERLVSAGMPEAAARAEAERRLGGLAHARGVLIRDAWDRDARLTLRDRLREVRDDVAYAMRSVFRERGYAAVVIITLALGIGANATMFGLLDRLLLTGPAHVVEPGDVYRFYVNTRNEHDGSTNRFAQMHGPALMQLRAAVPSMTHASGYMTQTSTLGAGVEARQLRLGGVSASFFDLLGVRPALGRFFDEAEDTPPAGERVIVLSHALWQSEFGGRRDVAGETIMLSGRPYVIVGVAPAGFTGVLLEPRDGWVPLSSTLAASMGENWATEQYGLYLPVVARLRPGATPERAAAEATAAWRAAVQDGPESHREAHLTLHPTRADAGGDEPMEARVARWLMAVAVIVLLVACANVANLYFARGLRRRREIAVRLAMGISRGRLLRLLLTESMLLAVLGGIAALFVAYWGAGIVRTVLLPDFDWTTSPLNSRVLAVSAVVTLLVGVVTGLAPALLAGRPDLAPSLAGSVHAPPAPGRARSVLAVLQAAFCVLLLVGAGVFVRSMWSVYEMNLGVDADRVMAVSFEWQTPPDLGDEERAELDARRRTFYGEAAARLAAEPGVDAASVAVGSVFGAAYFARIRVDGLDSIPSMPGGGPYMSAISPGYFATLGTPVLRGRVFGPGEGAGTDPVVVVSRTTADALWPGSDPLGRCVYMATAPDAPCSRVVGVVADLRRFRIVEDAAFQFYVPLGQQPTWMSGVTLLARTSVRPDVMGEPLRRVLYGLEPSLRFVNMQPFSEYLEPQRRPWKLGATLFALCGVLALVIAALGLYSVIAYLVLHRRHEIGVRMALGAGRNDVMRMVLRQSLLLTGAGVIIGVVAALLAAPHVEPLLFETSAVDPAVFAVVAATLVAAAVAAGMLPAWRASRVQPTEALRDS